MSYRFIERGEDSFDITFILYNRYVHYRGKLDKITGKYYVKIHTLYEDGSTEKVSKLYSRDKVNKKIEHMNNQNTGSILKMMETLY